MLVTIFLILSFTIPAQQSADVASPRTDKNSMLAHEQLLEKGKKGKIDLYFLGDSIKSVCIHQIEAASKDSTKFGKNDYNLPHEDYSPIYQPNKNH